MISADARAPATSTTNAAALSNHLAARHSRPGPNRATLPFVMT